MYSEVGFVEFIRPAIEGDDDTILGLIQPHIEAALVGRICTRGSLARMILG